MVWFQILEQFVLSCDLMVMFEMVDHLTEIMGKALEVDISRDWWPPEVKVRLLIVSHLHPQKRASFSHYFFDQCRIVSINDLVFKETPSLCLGQKLAAEIRRCSCCTGSCVELRHPFHYQLIVDSLLDTWDCHLWCIVLIVELFDCWVSRGRTDHRLVLVLQGWSFNTFNLRLRLWHWVLLSLLLVLVETIVWLCSEVKDVLNIWMLIVDVIGT